MTQKKDTLSRNEFQLNVTLIYKEQVESV